MLQKAETAAQAAQPATAQPAAAEDSELSSIHDESSVHEAEAGESSSSAPTEQAGLVAQVRGLVARVDGLTADLDMERQRSRAMEARVMALELYRDQGFMEDSVKDRWVSGDFLFRHQK